VHVGVIPMESSAHDKPNSTHAKSNQEQTTEDKISQRQA
jgi:hypothetical protein